MPYTFERGLNDVAERFACYHNMSVDETKEYFERVGIIPLIEKYYAGLAYCMPLLTIKTLRREIAALGQPLPKQVYFRELSANQVPIIPWDAIKAQS